MSHPDRSSWRRIGLEVVVVVGSVLMAFGIQAWWDGRVQHDLRVATLEGLLVDFEGNRDYLASIVEGNRRYLDSERLLIALLVAGAEQSPVLIPDSLLVPALTYPTYDPPRAAVEMALGSGRLTTMEDQALRGLLTRWLQDLADTAEDEMRVAEIVEDKILPILASTPGLGELLADLPTRSIFQVPDLVRGSSRFVTPTDELVGLLGARVSHTQTALWGLSSLAETQEEIATSLRSALEPG